MPVLKRHGVDGPGNAGEDLVPLLFVLFHRNGVLAGEFAARGHDGLFAVDPRGDEDRQPARNALALHAHFAEGVDGAFRRAGNLAAQVPAAEAVVLLAVHLPHLVDDVAVGLDLRGHVARVPVLARIVEPEIELHAVFFGQPQVHVHQVDRRHVTPPREEVLGRVGDEFAVAAADQDDGVDADGLHVAEILVPLLFAPVLVGDVVGNFVEEGAGDRQGVLRGHDQPGRRVRGAAAAARREREHCQKQEGDLFHSGRLMVELMGTNIIKNII